MPDNAPQSKAAALLEPLKAVFALPNDHPNKTIAVAVALCLVCSLIVSAAAVGLRPLQERNESLALKREILKVAGLYQPGVDIEGAFNELDARLVDLQTGEYVTDVDAAAFDMRKAAADPAQSIALSNDDDLARIRNRANVMPVYLLRDGEQVKSLILDQSKS